MKKTLMLSLALAAALALVAACGGEEDVTGPQPVAMTTPAAVLDNVEYSWNHCDINLFKACLSPNFIFYFNPLDVGSNVGGYIIPVSWNYNEMTTAVGNMLTEVYSVSVNIPTGNVATPPPNATVWRVDNISIYLLVYVTADSGYQVEGGYCNFEFEKYKGGDGKDYWRMTKWWDFTTSSGMASGVGVAASSLGRVLATFK